MESGVPFGDIIVLGAIAAFIVLRYRAMLGEERGRDPRDTKNQRAEQPAKESEAERVIQFPRNETGKLKKDSEEKSKYPPEIAEGFAAIAERDKQFEPDAFLDGAKIAFEMTIAAFNERDKETLHMLLGEEVYGQFDEVLKEQEETEKFAHTTLVTLKKAEFVTAKLDGSTAKITIDFESEQIQLVKNADGDVIEGDVSEQEVVEDRWVFARNVRAASPDWKITETQ